MRRVQKQKQRLPEFCLLEVEGFPLGLAFLGEGGGAFDLVGVAPYSGHVEGAGLAGLGESVFHGVP